MRITVVMVISLVWLFLMPAGAIASPDREAKPPRDAGELTKQMSQIIDYIDSVEYADVVSWPEHIVLSYRLSRGVDPTLLEFSIINANRAHLEMDRRTALAIAIAGDSEMPTWTQLRAFLATRSAADFRSSASTRNKAQELAATPLSEIGKALELAREKEQFNTSQLAAQHARVEQKTLPGVQYNTYFGFLHAHSRLSDGSGGPDEAYSYARDVAGMDFFALTDHGINMIVFPWESSKYRRLLRAADNHDAPGSYAALYGFEWSHPWDGHINVMNVRSFTHVLRRITLGSIYRWIGDRPYSFGRYNHPGRQDDLNNEFRHFSLNTGVLNNMVGVEGWNKGHDFGEQFYLCSWGSCQAPTFMDEGIRKGWRLGVLGGGDNHHRQWGTTTDYRVGVLATQLTRENIVNAYFDRRFYATEDKNLRLDVRVQGHPMGSRLTNSIRQIDVEACDSTADTFAEVRLYRDGHLLDMRNVAGNCVQATFDDSNSSGANHYYIVVRQHDGDEAISSPISITGPAPPSLPVACFDYSCSGFSCAFDASCSTGHNGISSYAWNFGDGASGNGANANHSYTNSGTYNVQLTVSDSIGQTDATSQQVSVSCGDTTRPNVSLTAPADGAVIWGSTTFSANASDNVGVDRVQFRIANDIACTDHNPPWSCQVNVNSYPTGDYPVKAVAFDQCGNHRVSTTRTAHIVSNPEMVIDLPAADGVVSGQAVAISGWATDPDTVTSLTITLDGVATIPVDYGTPRPDVCQAVPVSDPNCPGVGFEATFNSRLYENGPHSITVVATDGSGQQTSQTRSFTIDNPPIMTCTPGPTTLCLRDGRFEVQAFYVNGGTGQEAHTEPFSDKSGFFWFFNSANLEVGVKVLGPANGHWWVFHGAATDREYTLAVTDTVTGAVKSYVKPGGSFCGDADTQAFPASSPAMTLQSGGGPDPEQTVTEIAKNGPCTPSSTRMCLQQDRFQVEVLRGGVAQTAAKLTADTGTVWFFNDENAEVFVKVLDGTGVNQHYWVFYGSLTDRDFTVRVVDTVTGQEVSYDNPLGNYCGNGDTTAF